MPCLYDYDEENQKYIYDAIMNAEHEKNPGPVYKWDANNKIYIYGNTLPHKKNYKYTKVFDPKSFMTRGDVICFGGNYRNERKMIFNGEKLEDLYTEVDDYGSVPPTYEVCDDGFDIGDFEDLIDHNSINWLSLKKLKEIKIFEKDNNVMGNVEIKGKLWNIYFCIYDDFNYNLFINSLNNLKITFENNKILFLDISNKNNIHKRNYLGTIKDEDISKLISVKKDSDTNLSVIQSTLNNCYYVYKVIKEYKITKDNCENPNMPCIFINNGKYKYELLLENKEMFHKRMSFEINSEKKEKTSWIIKEIIYCPFTVEIIKKNNETFIKDITDFINYKIEKYDDINERIPISRSDNDILEINL